LRDWGFWPMPMEGDKKRDPLGGKKIGRGNPKGREVIPLGGGDYGPKNKHCGERTGTPGV